MGKIRYEVSNRIGRILIDNPERRNALDPELLTELWKAFEQSKRNGDLCVVLTSIGQDFSVGLDLEYTKKLFESGSLPDIVTLIDSFQNVTKAICSHPGVIIAGLKGYAIGGAFEITLACDLRIASSDTKIMMPELKVGTMLTNGSTKLLPRIVGESKAKEIILIRDSISAEEALDMGLVNQLVEPNNLENHLEAIAKKIAKKAPLSIYFAKKLLSENQEIDMEKVLEREFIANLICDLSPDFREGVMAFFEKREPEFTENLPK